MHLLRLRKPTQFSKYKDSRITILFLVIFSVNGYSQIAKKLCLHSLPTYVEQKRNGSSRPAATRQHHRVFFFICQTFSGYCRSTSTCTCFIWFQSRTQPPLCGLCGAASIKVLEKLIMVNKNAESVNISSNAYLVSTVSIVILFITLSEYLNLSTVYHYNILGLKCRYTITCFRQNVITFFRAICNIFNWCIAQIVS